jgi:diguanylate cyclase (GGDEF)-like protein/PAS domain S-box-containing protein
MALSDNRVPDSDNHGGLESARADELIDPVWTVYFDERPLEINRPVAGYSLEEWRHGGKAFYRRIFTHESYKKLTEVKRRMRATRRPLHNVEVTLRTKDGSRLLYLLVNYRPVLDIDGEVIGIRGETRNITDLRAAQGKLGRDISMLATLIQNSPNLIWVGFLDAQPGFANRSFGGFDASQWAQGGVTFFREHLTDDSRRRFDRAINYLEASNESVRNLELDFQARPEAPTLRLLATFSPIFGGEGVVTGIQGILHDVSELTMTRRALEKSESRFRDIIESAHDLVWTVDRDGKWIYLNHAAMKFYGYAREELIGKPFSEMTHPDHRDKDLRAFEEVLRGRELTQHETVHLHKDGGVRYLSFNIQPRLDENWEIIGAMGMARDMTEQKLYQHQLEHLADHDVLTGLFNRHYFEKELARAVAQAARDHHPVGLLYIDLDNFKYVNDTLGHATGDRLLLQVAQRLLGRQRQGDLLARFGGDEFTVLLQNMNPSLLLHVAQSFLKLFEGYTFLEGEKVFDIRVSLGATLIKPDTLSGGEALAQADLACTLAKSRGRNSAHLYNPADQEVASMVSEVSWSHKINQALEHDRFVLHFQPVMNTGDGRLSHHEALLRMRDDSGELIAPGLFLPAAERFGLMQAIDRWVVGHAIHRLADDRSRGHTHRLAINLSARVFGDVEFLEFLRELLERSAIDPRQLIFEITETAAISHMASARELIEQLKLLNCEVALDDFGSGFSSYSYLKHLPVDYLKIDGSFIQHLAREAVDQAIVQSMNQVAHALGRQTVAEYVEDAQTLDILRRYGVDFVQGYHLGKPTATLLPGD